MCNFGCNTYILFLQPFQYWEIIVLLYVESIYDLFKLKKSLLKLTAVN